MNSFQSQSTAFEHGPIWNALFEHTYLFYTYRGKTLNFTTVIQQPKRLYFQNLVPLQGSTTAMSCSITENRVDKDLKRSPNPSVCHQAGSVTPVLCLAGVNQFFKTSRDRIQQPPLSSLFQQSAGTGSQQVNIDSTFNVPYFWIFWKWNLKGISCCKSIPGQMQRGKSVFHFNQNYLKAVWYNDSLGILPIWKLLGMPVQGEFPQFQGKVHICMQTPYTFLRDQKFSVSLQVKPPESLQDPHKYLSSRNLSKPRISLRSLRIQHVLLAQVFVSHTENAIIYRQCSDMQKVKLQNSRTLS